ncbi:hypothetical protein F5878DRAFT_692914 [Lentinula raphanica]|uniref:Retrovirus-related Pol polyprotein from transposon TNT 1-94-like beta-barrel domain-containing protein n=1 Tax=Lentinula raphanica TaxID=153919 RepID=A0AA38P309_9AGAR|nr:hypothetical protein F5878DRAFT_692914 [Lentinula raphanica]
MSHVMLYNTQPAANQTTVDTGDGIGTVYALSATTFKAISIPRVNSAGWDCTFADSGATAHFFADRSMFRNYVEKKGLVGNSSKKGVSFEILSQGDVDVRVTHQDKVHTLTFHNALHAPSITSSLISLSILDGLGWTMSIGQGQIIFREPGGCDVFSGRLVDGLYLVEDSFKGKYPEALTARSLQLLGDKNLWHRITT